MIKQKKSIEKWAKEIVRCELILQDVHSSKEEVEQAYEPDLLFSYEPDSLFELLSAVEEKMFLEQFDKNK